MATFSASARFSAIDAITAPVSRMARATQSFATKAAASFGSVATASRTLGTKLQGLSGHLISLRSLLIGSAIFGAAKYLLGMAEASKNATVENLRLSQRLGMTYVELKQMQYAAKLAGMSTDEFAMASMRFNRSIGDARLNTGKLTSFLKLHDRTLLNNIKGSKTYSQAFDLMANAMVKIKDPAIKASFATAAFGRNSLKIISLLNKGASGMAQLRKEYGKYGDLTAKITNAQNSQKLIEAQARFDTVMGSLKTTIGNSLLPVITDLTQRTADYFAENKKMIKSNIKSFFEGVGEAVRFLGNHIKLITTVIAAYTGAVILLKVAMIATKTVTVIATAVQYAYATAMAIAYIATGNLTEGLLANSAALKMVSAWEWLVTAATWAFSAALWSTGIPEIVIGIVALCVGIYELYKHWGQITDFVSNSNSVFAKWIRISMLPIILIFKAVKWAINSLIEVFSSLWNWFKDTSIYSGILKGFGHVKDLFHSVGNAGSWLLSKVMKIWGYLEKFANFIATPFKDALNFGDSVVKSELNVKNGKAVNKDVSKMTIEKNNTTKNHLQIDINDPKGLTNVNGNLQGIPVRSNSTRISGGGGPC